MAEISLRAIEVTFPRRAWHWSAAGISEALGAVAGAVVANGVAIFAKESAHQLSETIGFSHLQTCEAVHAWLHWRAPPRLSPVMSPVRSAGPCRLWYQRYPLAVPEPKDRHRGLPNGGQSLRQESRSRQSARRS